MNILQAKNDILDVFRTGWLSNSESENIIVFYRLEDEKEDLKSADKSWARVTIKHYDLGAKNQSLSSSNGTKKYNRDGFIQVDIFTPLGSGIELESNLAQIVLNSFEGKSSENGVWFLNARILEDGISSSWSKMIVKINFKYSDFK